MEGITKSFPGVKALDGVSLTVRAGTVHALMGENGAGKSTLMKCLFGVYNKDGGHIYLEGKEINFKNSKDALENGVAMVHQELNQALKRNVMDNIWLGRYPMNGPFVSEAKMYQDTVAVFDDLGIHVEPTTIMSTMPVSQRQMVEIAKAVSYNSKIIVFDEPTSSLTEEEVEHLFRIINMLRDRGCGIIYISHKMDEILRISDDITVMRDGTWVATEPVANMTMDKIIKLMVGRELTNRFPPKENVVSKEVSLSVRGLTGMYSALRDVSFDAHKGEILGLAGLDGSGRTETLETIFGAATKKSGTVTLNGRDTPNRTTKEAVANGYALLTEERRATGIFGILSILENTVISSLKNYLQGGFLNQRKMEESTDWSISAMRIKTPSQSTQIRSLSGGNQQKVILARWLLTHPDYLILDEPTRGIDVGTKVDIQKLVLKLASEGMAVTFISSETDEMLRTCSRLIVMRDRHVVGELTGDDLNQNKIMSTIAGGENDGK